MTRKTKSHKSFAAALDSAPQGFRLLAAAAIAHASIVLVLWLGGFYAEWGFIPWRWWLWVFWLWVLWPPALILHPAGNVKRVSLPAGLGLAIVAPCIPTALAFTDWAILGFAL